jgi:hypothetical protein
MVALYAVTAIEVLAASKGYGILEQLNVWYL